MKEEFLEVSFHVLKNHEEQYSLWPSFKAVPEGWKIEKESLSKNECLKYIEDNWKDMRPLSLRERMSK